MILSGDDTLYRLLAELQRLVSTTWFEDLTPYWEHNGF